MNNTFTYPREIFEQQGLNRKMITELISKHRSVEAERLRKNKSYYDGKHAIQNNERKKDGAPNQKPVCNHAKDISDTASGYFMGNPISYESKDRDMEIDKLLQAFNRADVNDVDQDNALLLSIYGCSYEYVYAAEGEAELNVKNLEPENTFIVYDDTIEHKELFGVYYYVKRDDVRNLETYVATVCTDTHVHEFVLYPSAAQSVEPSRDKEPAKHNLGYVPIVEYKNNKFCIGDFEQQIGLIDAYNTLMADRVNDKEQFIDAILVIYGAMLGDTEKESEEAQEQLKKKRLLELPEDARAEYLIRTFDEAGVETLRKALKEDIYTFSHVPNLTDENFAGNSSGVAMEYKLLGLEMLTKIKERYYRKALKKRLKLFCHFLGLKAVELDAGLIIPTFSRALPKNLAEIANMIATLSDSVSKKTLIKLLPFVEDPDAEVEAVEQEKEKAVERQQKMFEQTVNNPPDDDE